MKKKIFVISKNNLKADFWLSHLNEDQVDVWKWSNVSIAVSSILNVKPDVIVLDNYFCDPNNSSWMQKAAQQLILLGYFKKIFCVSPEFQDCEQAAKSIPLTSCTNFNSDLLDQLNEIKLENNGDAGAKTFIIPAVLNQQSLIKISA